MKQKITTLIILATAALAISLTACDDSSSAPSGDDQNEPSSETITSSESNGNSATSQNGKPSAGKGKSSSSTEPDEQCDALIPQCGFSEQELCEMGIKTYCSTSSSSFNMPTCSHLTDSDCRISEGCSPTPCNPGTRVLDCVTNSEYVCKSGSWQLAETCANISSVTGNDRWNCDEDDFTLTKDCADNSITYMCVSNRWFKTEDCDPTKPNCGYDDYTLCLKTKLKKYCLKTDWLNESCSYGKDPIRWLYTYNDPEDDYPSDQIRYSCNQSGKWEEFVQQCDPMMDCGNGNNKSDDHGILPDGAPCTNEGEQMTVSGYNYQCISKTWTRL